MQNYDSAYGKVEKMDRINRNAEKMNKADSNNINRNTKKINKTNDNKEIRNMDMICGESSDSHIKDVKDDNNCGLYSSTNGVLIMYNEIPDDKFDNVEYKNYLIKSCDADYIAFINTSYTNSTEISQIIMEAPFLMNYDMVIFGEGILQGNMHFNTLVNCLDMKPYAVILKKSVLGDIGCFNRQLKCGDIYEMALRVEYEHYDDNVCGVYGVECEADTKCNENRMNSNIRCIQIFGGDDINDNENSIINNNMSVTERKNNILLTYAYVIRKYMCVLKNDGLLENVLDNMTSYAADAGQVDTFNAYVMDFLNNSELYKRVETDTAPFYIIMGDDICYGVLNRFAVCLIKELIESGQAVITSDGSYGKTVELSYIEKHVLKGIVGFQAPVLFKEYFKTIDCPKYIFWFDHPVYFKDMLEKTDDSYHMLCQDRYYAEFMRKYYHIHNAIQLPPGGEDAGYISINSCERKYDIVFIGSYHVLGDEVIQDEFQKVYYDYMMCNPAYTFEQGLDKLLKEKKLDVSEERFLDILCSLQNVCRKIVYDYRIKVIEAIIKSGIKIDVFGETWKRYDGMYKDNLIIHNAVSVDEALKVWGHSRIGLNIMTWHKSGMTERIANICLSGAVCLTDSSEYLEKNFDNHENIVMYDLERLDKLPDIISRLLSDDEYRQNIAGNAYMLARGKHTWKARVEEFLEYVVNE